jgi:cyclopropane fatty-acyl-phospholipid synthase-like methyltransferase
MTSTDRNYFEEMYDGNEDPWGFASREYEQRKYALTMASLPRPRYASAFEPGCSIGVLTEMLAARCDEVLATDVVSDTVRHAQRRLGALPQVTVELRGIPELWPAATFDLVVLSEIAYYFDESDLGRVLSLIVSSTRPGAHLVAVHWRGVTDYPLSGDRVHEIIAAAPQLVQVVEHVEAEFLLGVWERR